MFQFLLLSLYFCKLFNKANIYKGCIHNQRVNINAIIDIIKVVISRIVMCSHVNCSVYLLYNCMFLVLVKVMVRKKNFVPGKSTINMHHLLKRYMALLAFYSTCSHFLPVFKNKIPQWLAGHATKDIS